MVLQELKIRVNRWSLSDPLHIRAAFVSALSRTGQDADVVSFASQALTIGTYATTALVAAGTLGVDTKPVLALAGSAGVALGFALRDFASNLLSGMCIFNDFSRYVVCARNATQTPRFISPQASFS